MLKKLFILALASLMLLGVLCACGEENPQTSTTSSKSTVVTYTYNVTTTTKPAQSATNPQDKTEDTTDSIWTGNKK